MRRSGCDNEMKYHFVAIATVAIATKIFEDAIGGGPGIIDSECHTHPHKGRVMYLLTTPLCTSMCIVISCVRRQRAQCNGSGVQEFVQLRG